MSNTLTYVAPKILAAGVESLREMAVTPRLVNRRYETLAGQKGSTIDIPIPSAIAAADVAPSETPTAGSNSAPTRVQVAMDFWKKAAFYLTDKEVGDVMDGVIPMQAGEAVKSLVNAVDAYILEKMYKASFSTSGAAATTPFATTIAAYSDARKKLNKELAPMQDRRVLLGPDAEANALGLSIFLNADARGDTGGIIDGSIGRKIGADWFMNQNIPTHTAGAPGGSPTGTGTAGAFTLTIAAGGEAGTFNAGDVFTMANSTQEYVVTEALTLNGSGAGTLKIYPALRSSPSGSAITLKATHIANLMFHRDAFAFASRPLSNIGDGLGNIMQTAIDEISGLVIRLEIERQNKQVKFEYDILCGGTVVRPEYIARILG